MDVGPTLAIAAESLGVYANVIILVRVRMETHFGTANSFIVKELAPSIRNSGIQSEPVLAIMSCIQISRAVSLLFTIRKSSRSLPIIGRASFLIKSSVNGVRFALLSKNIARNVRVSPHER